MSVPRNITESRSGTVGSARLNGGVWQTHEIETLLDLRAGRGWACAPIAAVLGRTTRSVRYKLTRLGIELPSTKNIGSMRDDAVLREAFAAGIPIKHAAASLGIEKTSVAKVYGLFSAELKQAGSDFTPSGGYIGAREMARIVAPVCGATARAILSESRYRPAVLGRMAIARALRDRGMSMSTIARALGRNDHTTILNNLKKFDDYARAFPQLACAHEAIRAAEMAASERLAA
ncbi:Chromosomal replication initiator, DnaA C-terminal [uncultured Caudovirales phage]|uniref:Chromosomal replication initiator, DnaA C-terminal n=1 Tax=uncultured Caudovirales phage TaxID=2100421 RepID=A0A6J7WY60_9CAUD|nr:Chromosomal replication initiator, DnaA C-terminal [uncultured Caudovirales phage]